MQHKIHIDGYILRPDDGLLLGNGDLSVSCYQKARKTNLRNSRFEMKIATSPWCDLERMIDEVGIDHPASIKAAKVLEETLKPLPGGSQAIEGGDHPALGAYRGDYLLKTKSIEFDEIRWQIAQNIIMLMNEK